MEAGKAVVVDGVAHTPTDLITAISASASPRVDDDGLDEVERSACPTCGSCSGMFTANSMNCLTEALGLSLPGNGSTLATHAARQDAVRARRPHRRRAGHAVLRRRRRVGAAPQHRHQGRVRATRWRSTSRWAARPTPCCTSSPPRRRARSTSTWPTSTRSAGGCRACPRSRRTRDFHMEDVHRAGGIPAILGELYRAGLLDRRRAHGALADAAGLARRVGRPRRHAVGRGARAVPRRARAGCAPPRRSPRPTAGSRSTPTPPTAASATSRTRTPSTAGWRCCAATSPPTAR